MLSSSQCCYLVLQVHNKCQNYYQVAIWVKLVPRKVIVQTAVMASFQVNQVLVGLLSPTALG